MFLVTTPVFTAVELNDNFSLPSSNNIMFEQFFPNLFRTFKCFYFEMRFVGAQEFRTQFFTTIYVTVESIS